MCTAFTNFAKYSDPNCVVLPEWAPYTKGNEVTMVFDRESKTRVNFNRKLIETHFKALNGGR
jgi:carboxylesterase type B